MTTAVIASGADGGTSQESALDAFRPGLVFAAAVSIAGAVVAALALVPRRRGPSPLEPALPHPELAATEV